MCIEYNKQLKMFLDACQAICGDCVKDYCSLLKQEFIVDSQHDPKIIVKTLNNIVNSEPHKPVAFVFGAGVSRAMPFNIPTWVELLRRANTNYFYTTYNVPLPYEDFHNEITRKQHCMCCVETCNFAKYSKDDFFNNFDVYELAQYIENNLRDKANNRNDSENIRQRVDSQMYEIVKACSYKNSEIEKKNYVGSLLHEICKIAVEKNVNRIITYNYDNCYEAIYENYKRVNSEYLNGLYTAFTDDQLPYAQKQESLGNQVIYHVHGYVPNFDLEECVTRNSISYDILERYNINNDDWGSFMQLPKAQSLVLSEDSYDEIALSGYKWRNTIQANTFQNYNCIFLGFSATDKNFKRLVKLMSGEENESRFKYQPVQHYILMDVNRFIADIFGLNIDSERIKDDVEKLYKYNSSWLLAKLEFLYFALRTRRKYLISYHIYPIWSTIKDLKYTFQKICTKQ